MYLDDMQLAVWADGEPRLAFWDPLESDDRVILLTADGAFEEVDDLFGESTELKPIDLLATLRAIAQEYAPWPSAAAEEKGDAHEEAI